MKRIVRNKRLIIALTILLANAFLVAVLAQGKKDEKVKLIWEKDFDENIDEVSIPDKAVGMLKAGKIPHRLVKDSKTLYFLNDKGQVIKTLQGKSSRRNFFVSPGGGYVLEVPLNPKFVGDDKKVHIMRDGEGNAIYEKPIIIPQAVYISDATGYISIVEWGDSLYIRRFFFYDASGNEIGKYETKERFTSGGGAWSPDGGMFAITKMGRQKINILVFNKSGNLLWNYEIKGELGILSWEIKFSEKGNYFLVSYSESSKKFFMLFTKHGELRQKFELPQLIGRISSAVSINEKYIAVAQLNKYYIYNIEKNVVGKEISLPGNFEIHSIDVSSSGNLIAVSGITDPSHRDASDIFLSLYNKEGQELYRSTSPGQSKGFEFLGRLAEVEISANGKNILLTGVKKMRFFELQFAK